MSYDWTIIHYCLSVHTIKSFDEVDETFWKLLLVFDTFFDDGPQLKNLFHAGSSTTETRLFFPQFTFDRCLQSSKQYCD